MSGMTEHGASRGACRIPFRQCYRERDGRFVVHQSQSMNRGQVFAALAAHGIERGGGSCTEYERAKRCLAAEWFADSVEYDQLIGFVEEFVGI